MVYIRKRLPRYDKVYRCRTCGKPLEKKALFCSKQCFKDYEKIRKMLKIEKWRCPSLRSPGLNYFKCVQCGEFFKLSGSRLKPIYKKLCHKCREKHRLVNQRRRMHTPAIAREISMKCSDCSARATSLFMGKPYCYKHFFAAKHSAKQAVIYA